MLFEWCPMSYFHGALPQAPYNALIQSTGGLPRTETVQRVFTGTLITAQHGEADK